MSDAGNSEGCSVGSAVMVDICGRWNEGRKWDDYLSERVLIRRVITCCASPVQSSMFHQTLRHVFTLHGLDNIFSAGISMSSWLTCARVPLLLISLCNQNLCSCV